MRTVRGGGGGGGGGGGSGGGRSGGGDGGWPATGVVVVVGGALACGVGWVVETASRTDVPAVLWCSHLDHRGGRVFGERVKRLSFPPVRRTHCRQGTVAAATRPVVLLPSSPLVQLPGCHFYHG